MPAIHVTFPSGHRARIEVEPNKPLRKALESACIRRSLDPTKHIFIHNRRPVDLSSTFRFSGLVNNASVELVASDTPSSTLDASSEVRICFRLNDGQRALWSGSPHHSLWDILNQLAADTPEIAHLLSMTCDSSHHCLAVVYLQEQVVGINKLKESTPADLGVLSGSALFQLKSVASPEMSAPTPSEACVSKQPAYDIQGDYTPMDVQLPSPILNTVQSQPDMQNVVTDTCLASENVEPSVSTVAATTRESADSPMTGITSPFSIFEERPTESIFGRNEQPKAVGRKPQTLGELLGISLEPTRIPTDPTPSHPGFQFSEFKFPSETAGLDLRSQFFDDSGCPTNREVDRQLVAFRQPHSSDAPCSPGTVDDIPDEFFEHTVNDLRSLLHHCRSEWASSEPLQTATMRQAAREHMYRKYPRAIIHFHWSDGLVLQCCFDPHERVSSLYDFIRQHLRSPHWEFLLYTTPPKVILKDKSATLIDADLVPMAKVYFSSISTKGEETLSHELLSNATVENAAIAKQIIQSWMSSVPGSHYVGDPSLSEKQPNASSSEGLPHGGPTTPPKWLRIGK